MKRERLIKTTKYIVLFVVIILLVLQGTFVFSKREQGVKLEKESDLNGRHIGLLLGASYNFAIQTKYPKSEFTYYATYSEMIQDLKTGRIDAYVADKPMAKAQQREAGGLKLLDGFLTKDDYGFILAPGNAKLCQDLNRAIEELREEGELDRLAGKWIDTGKQHYMELDANAPAPKGVLRIATNADSAPFSYNYSGEIIGYDVEVLGLAAQKLGYRIQTTQYAFGSLLNSVISGQEDIAVGGITHTEERSRAMLFTDNVYEGGTVAIVADYRSSKNPVDNVKDGIYRMLIMEQRWKLIVMGIGVTLLVSLVTLVLGSFFGIVLSILTRSEKRWVARLFSDISTVIDTIPLLIILMIFYYVVFARYRVSATLIAIIGLTLVFANTVAGLLNTGLLAVDRGQLEAAEAMGYRKDQVFFKIAFPQILRQMYSQYIGAVTSMVKDTSIVGYITVQDLTNVSDTIRSMTYQAFFPLLLTATVYFLIAKLIVMILTRVMEHFHPETGVEKR